jgi:hypothetical protein
VPAGAEVTNFKVLLQEGPTRDCRLREKKRIQRQHQASYGGGITSGELAVRGEDEGWTRLAISEGIGFEPAEVGDVLGYECPHSSDCRYEHLVVRRTLEAPVFGIMKGDDIVAACSELLGHGGWIHLVKEKPQPRSWCSRSSV